MNFIDQCKSKLTQQFGLNEQQLQAEHLVIDMDRRALHVEFLQPSDSVSVHCLGGSAGLEDLPLPEQYLVLQRALETNAELYERSLLRLYLDEGSFGVAMDCSPLNCADADRFMAALQELLSCKELLENPVV